MKKNFRNVKATLIIGILLTSAFSAIMPITSAKEGGLIGFAHIVTVEWQDVPNATKVIAPFEESRAYDLIVKYSLTRGPFGGILYALFYAGQRVDIKLDIQSYPEEWSSVTMFTNTISFSLPSSPEDTKEWTHSLLISLYDNAPAFKEGKIAIRVTVNAVGMIEEFDRVIELTMKPDYAPQLNVLAETQHKLIGPMDTAEIPIRITNLGNGQTKVFCRLPSIPENWEAIVTDQITLDPDQTGTIYLTVKPPKGFGYHDDYEAFIVECTPAWSENTKLQGIAEQVSVAVESRGISVIGIEVILPIIILIILVVIAVYLFIKRMQRK